MLLSDAVKRHDRAMLCAANDCLFGHAKNVVQVEAGEHVIGNTHRVAKGKHFLKAFYQ